MFEAISKKMARQSKIVIVKKGHKYAYGRARNWQVKYSFHWKDIPDNLSLTKRAITHWKNTKSPLGYTNFKTLTENDIISILSGAKNSHLTMVNINRQGDTAYYKVLNPA
jgi:hypothetical protein